MRIYLDNNATTQIDPAVLEAVYRQLKEHYGNPSSIHSFGQENRRRLLQARQDIASYLTVQPQEIFFTSGGTEALNMLITGAPVGHILSSSVEHACVYATIKRMETKGCSTTFLSPGLWGAVTVEAVRAALRPDTHLIVLMAVNNETGVKTDIASIAMLAQEMDIPLIVDGVAWLGKEPISIPAGVSAVAFSGHKIHAPTGVGCAFVRKSFKVQPLITGGEQEYGRRGGTENMSGIIGLAAAIKELSQLITEAAPRMARLRDRLEQQLLMQLPGACVNGQGPRVANTTNISFLGIEGETLLAALDMEGIAVSHGSACSSGALEPSRILLNMGISMEGARSAIRFSLSRFTTAEEIDSCIDTVVKVVRRLRLRSN